MTLDDHHRPDVEDRLRTVLRSRADEVEPAHDAYARLAARVAGRSHRPWWRPPAALAVPALAAALAAVVAVGLLLGGDGDDARIDAVAPPAGDDATATTTSDTTPSDATAPDTTAPDTTAPTTTAPPASGPTSTDQAVDVGTLAFPGGDRESWPTDPLAVARDFAATVLDAPDLALDPPQGDLVPVRATGGGGVTGEVVGALRLVQHRSLDGRTRWGVIGAETSTIRIDRPSPGDAVGNPVEVGGASTSFEAALVVRVVGLDGTELGGAMAMGGAGPELEPFSGTVAGLPSAPGPAFVVVTAEPAADGATGRHAAVPVELGAGPALPATFRVVRVAGDDADGGLVVRDGPSTGAAAVAVLAPASGGVQRVGPAEGGWWLVTDGSVEGWVNSAYLALDVPLDERREADLLAVTTEVAAALAAGDGDRLAALPWDQRGPVLVGWAGRPEAVPAGQLRDAAFWTSDRTWPLPEAFAPDEVVAPFTAYATAGGAPAGATGVDDCCTDTVSDRAEVRALHHGSVTFARQGSSDWAVARVHLDWSTGEARVVALLVERWEP